MKKKRTKSSNLTHSIKKKRRKQEQNFKADGLKYTRNNTTGSAPFMFEDNIPLSRSDHTYKKEPLKKYCYEFTNSRFIYFLAKLSPTEYLIFITIISWMITEELSTQEAKIIYAFLNNVTDGMQTLVEQELILENYNNKVESKALGDSLQNDIDFLHAEIEKLKKAMP